jgi:hypothetical protein
VIRPVTNPPEMLPVYTRDAELFAGNAAAGTWQSSSPAPLTGTSHQWSDVPTRVPGHDRYRAIVLDANIGVQTSDSLEIDRTCSASTAALDTTPSATAARLGPISRQLLHNDPVALNVVQLELDHCRRLRRSPLLRNRTTRQRRVRLAGVSLTVRREGMARCRQGAL